MGGLAGIARWLDFLALGIYTYQLTQSPTLVAVISVVRFAPFIVIGLAVGALADAFDNRRLLIRMTTAMVCVTAGMSALAAFDLAGYAAIAATSLFSGLFWLSDMPLRRRLLIESVGPQRMTSVLGFDNSMANATRAIGPLLGGAAYEVLGIGGLYAVIAGIYLVSLYLAWSLRLRVTGSPGSGQRAQRFSLRQVLLPPRELVTDRRLLIVLGVTLVYNLWCFPFVTMIPVLGQHDFALSPVWVGALSACEGIGATLGAIMVGLTATNRTQFVYYFWGPMSILLIVAALSYALVAEAAFVAICLLGIGSACFSATQYALVFLIAPPEMRGRATGILTIAIGSAALGIYNIGWLFETFGSAPAMKLLALQGVPVLTLLGLLWWRTPARPVARSQQRPRA